MKLCLASRPVNAFPQRLSKLPHLTMQDHNNVSIRLYAESCWQSRNIDAKAQAPNDLTKALVQKGQGNFLWARLTMDDLLLALEEGQDFSTLSQKLVSLPLQVQEMYQSILDRIPGFLRLEAAMLIQLILEAGGRVELRKLYAAYSKLVGCLNLAGQSIPLDVDYGNKSRIAALLGAFLTSVRSAECA